MEKKIIFDIKALYRDDFRVTGYRFGNGKPSCCIVGSMRGNEYQQMYVCSQLVNRLKKLEAEGAVADGCEICVIPSANPYSMNIKKRFWSIDNTDINRMFPGYSEGETTQRIAAGIFEYVKEYEYGIQFASFYMPGNFVPQVRIMKTGLEETELAEQFGLPYVVLHNPRPFDTTTLNYNWQIWDTAAFSIYTTSSTEIDKESAEQGVEAVLRFMANRGLIRYKTASAGIISKVIENHDFVSVRSNRAGFYERYVAAGEHVRKDSLLAVIRNPYDAEIEEELRSPCDGVVAFARNGAMIYQNTAAYKLIPDQV